MPETHNIDQTLLFGVLAVQMDCIDREVLAESLEQWSLNPDQPLSSILRRREAASDDVLNRIDALVQEQIDRHDGDPSRTLANLPGAENLTAELVRYLHAGTIADSPISAASAEPGGTLSYGALPGEKSEEEFPATEADPYATLAEGSGSEVPPTMAGRPTEAVDRSHNAPSPPSLDASNLEATAPFGRAPSDFDPLETSVGERVGPGSTPEGLSSGSSGDPLATSALLAPFSGSGEALRSSSGFPSGSSSRFRVLRPHAKGGLGAVLVAFDEELRREVALKEIQGKHADDPTSRARFLLEAEVTGGLEHPGVVPVYSLGAGPDGRPYYAMRFIRGESLREAIKKFQDPDTGPKDPGERSLQLRQLLRRFLDTCNAIEYAHSRQIIHRDLKPDNIMLGPYGETLVVDWGLAKPLDRLELSSATRETPLRPSTFGGSTPTLDGSAIGTPAFMAPEQAVGDLERMGPACDIYSLGATLYQLLTGKPAFTDRNVFATLLKVKDGEFPRPREVKPDVPRPLEAICLKAMALDPKDRYPSCRAMADDIDHWLADEPVSVYREPWTARLARWARRHKTAVTGIAALMLTAIVALSIGTVLISQEQAKTLQEKIRADEQAVLAQLNEAEAVKNAELAQLNEVEAVKNAELARLNEVEAVKNADEAAQQRDLALKYFKLSMDAVDGLLTQVAEIDLADAPQMEGVRKALLERALQFFTIFLIDYDTDLVRREGGVAHSRTGDIKELLGELTEAQAEYEKAIEIQQALLAVDPDSEQYRVDLARTRNNLGILLKKLNEFEDSEAAFQESLNLRLALLDQNRQDPDRRRELAESKYHLGAMLARLQGRAGQVRELYDEAIATQRQLVEESPDSSEDHRALARYLNNLGILLGRSEQDTARQIFREAIETQRALLEQSQETPHYRRELARSINNLATYSAPQATEVAEESYQEAVEIARGLTADFPKVPDYWQELAGYLSNLGNFMIRTGQEEAADEIFQEAEQALRKALEIRERLVENYPNRPEYKQRLAIVLNNLGALLHGRNDDQEAEPFLLQGIELFDELVEKYPNVPEYKMDLARILNEMGMFHASQQDLEGTRKQLQRAIELGEQAAVDRSEEPEFLVPLRNAHTSMASLSRKQGEFREAATHIKESVKGTDNPSEYFDAAIAYLRLASAMLEDGHPKPEFEAFHSECLDQAIEMLEEAARLGFDRPQDLDVEGFDPLRDLQRFQDLRQRLKPQDR